MTIEHYLFVIVIYLCQASKFAVVMGAGHRNGHRQAVLLGKIWVKIANF